MDKKAKQTTDFYRLVAWAHANRKRLVWITSSVLAIGLVIGLLIWQGSHRESAAAEAFSLLKLPVGISEGSTGGDANGFIQVADTYSDTRAGAHARLVAGGILFDAGKYKEAQTQFERFLAEYPDSSLANQAALGIAACQEGQGMISEAVTRYEGLISKGAAGSATAQAKSALARLYIAQKKPDRAFQIYGEIAQGNANDSWAVESRMQGEQLVAKNPQLIKKPEEPAPITVPTPLPTNIPPTLMPAISNNPPKP